MDQLSIPDNRVVTKGNRTNCSVDSSQRMICFDSCSCTFDRSGCSRKSWQMRRRDWSSSGRDSHYKSHWRMLSWGRRAEQKRCESPQRNSHCFRLPMERESVKEGWVVDEDSWASSRKSVLQMLTDERGFSRWILLRRRMESKYFGRPVFFLARRFNHRCVNISQKISWILEMCVWETYLRFHLGKQSIKRYFSFKRTRKNTQTQRCRTGGIEKTFSAKSKRSPLVGNGVRLRKNNLSNNRWNR